MRQGVWPQFYIGAYPYCFALPEYKAQTWPPPAGSSPQMGQSPGTHWYHAHKHGSTAINVGNGMVGAFIIEGPSYDGALNQFYRRWQVDGQPWNTQTQKVMVLNQLQTVPNRLAGVFGPSPDFVVNGLRQPQLTMRPGEVQLWRIVNAAGRSAAFFQAPKGLQWRQIAQDGVQFANQNYVGSENQALYVAPGNRIDLLVKAPDSAPPPNQAPFEVRIQSVMARGKVLPIPLRPDPGRSRPQRGADDGRGDRTAGHAGADAVHSAGTAAARVPRRHHRCGTLAAEPRHQPDDVRFAGAGNAEAAHDQHPAVLDVAKWRS